MHGVGAIRPSTATGRRNAVTVHGWWAGGESKAPGIQTRPRQASCWTGRRGWRENERRLCIRRGVDNAQCGHVGDANRVAGIPCSLPPPLPSYAVIGPTRAVAGRLVSRKLRAARRVVTIQWLFVLDDILKRQSVRCRLIEGFWTEILDGLHRARDERAKREIDSQSLHFSFADPPIDEPLQALQYRIRRS